MKNTFIVFSLMLALTACSSGDSADKKAELEKLRSDQAALQDKITKLETELAASGNMDTDIKAKEIIVTTAQVQPFIHYVEVQAKVDADENVAVSSEMPGIVTRINVKVGDKVTKGKVLAELDYSSITKGMDELQSQRDFANTLYLKQKSLWDQKIGTEVQFLGAKNNLDALDRKLQTVRQQIDMMRIKSPINGTVDAVNVKLGQAVSPGMQSIRVVNLNNLKVKAEIAETYISKVKQGNDVIIVFPDLNKEIKTKLNYAGKVIDPMNRTFNAEVNISDKAGELHPNMIAILKIADYQSANALSIPVNLVQGSEEGNYIFIAEGNKEKAVAKRRIVTTGRNYNGNVEILSGLNEGDFIITTGYQDLIEGQPVKF